MSLIERTRAASTPPQLASQPIKNSIEGEFEPVLPKRYTKTEVNFREVIARAIHKYKRKEKCTYEYIAEEVGVSERAVRDWAEARSRITATSIMALADLFGADFLNDFLVSFGYGGVFKLHGGAITAGSLHYAIANMNNLIAQAREDEHVDHNEKREIKRELIHLIAIASAYIDGGE